MYTFITGHEPEKLDIIPQPRPVLNGMVSGYAKDAEKYLEAALAGWRVLRLTERQLEIGTIERIVALLNILPAEDSRSTAGQPQ